MSMKFDAGRGMSFSFVLSLHKKAFSFKYISTTQASVKHNIETFFLLASTSPRRIEIYDWAIVAKFNLTKRHVKRN